MLAPPFYRAEKPLPVRRAKAKNVYLARNTYALRTEINLGLSDNLQDTGHYDPSFTLDLCLKDLGLIQDLQDGLHADLPLTEAARDPFTLAAQRYGAQAAELHVAKRIEDDGLSFRLPGDWTPPWNRPTRNHRGPKTCLIVRPSGIVKVPSGAGQRALTFLLYSCSPSAALRAASSATLTARRCAAAPSPSTPGLPSYAMTHSPDLS